VSVVLQLLVISLRSSVTFEMPLPLYITCTSQAKHTVDNSRKSTSFQHGLECITR